MVIRFLSIFQLGVYKENMVFFSYYFGWHHYCFSVEIYNEKVYWFQTDFPKKFRPLFIQSCGVISYKIMNSKKGVPPPCLAPEIILALFESNLT